MPETIGKARLYLGTLWAVALLCMLIAAVHGLWFTGQRERPAVAVMHALHITGLSVTPSGHTGRYPALRTANVDPRHSPGIPGEVSNTDTIVLSPGTTEMRRP